VASFARGAQHVLHVAISTPVGCFLHTVDAGIIHTCNHPAFGSRSQVRIDDKGKDVVLNVTEGVRVVAVGKSPQFKVFPENSTNFFQIRFGKVYEATPSGQRVEGHAISSLAGETQAFSFGECMLLREWTGVPLQGMPHAARTCHLHMIRQHNMRAVRL
jgi:hypothetical protein